MRKIITSLDLKTKDSCSPELRDLLVYQFFEIKSPILTGSVGVQNQSVYAFWLMKSMAGQSQGNYRIVPHTNFQKGLFAFEY